MQKREKHPHQQQQSSQTGGREFGNVIEPMQAQMASGNRGLADDSGTRSGHRQPESPRKKTRKKAA